MRYLPVVMLLLLSPPRAAVAQISIQIGLPSVSIGFDRVEYPELVAVPGYPVYYDPYADSNYFFYDGLYWVYERDTWYASSWYNGPWDMVETWDVPLFILRVPVTYYRRPPRYFLAWRADEPPRWGEHWGRDWERRRGGWDRWDRREVPPPAPLPVYQRQYSGDRYPRPEQQHAVRAQNYRHEPRDAAVTKVYQAQVQRAPRPPVQPAAQPPAHPPRQSVPAQRGEPRQGGQPAARPPAQAAPPMQVQPARPLEPERRPAPRDPQQRPQPRAPQEDRQAKPPQERPQAREPQRASPAGPPQERPQARESQRASPAGPPQERPQAREQGQENRHKQGAPQEPRREAGQDKGEERGRDREH